MLKVPQEREAGVMICRPSFEPEECLVLHESAAEPTSFTLILTKADQNIWYSMPDNRDDGKPQPIHVTRREVPLAPELAHRVGRLWDRMLQGVHYPIPTEPLGGCDGVEIEFEGNGKYGQTWSPEGGAPARFVALGHALINYCDATEANRAARLKVVEIRCQFLEQYLDKQAAP